jgi:hypothetical protein
MKEFNHSVLEEAKIVAITKNCLKSHVAKWPLDFTSMICCTEPELADALYILHMHLIICNL